MSNGITIVLAILLPIIAGALIPFLRFKSNLTRKTYVLTVTIASAALILLTYFLPETSVTLIRINDDLQLTLHSDGLSKLFSCLIAVIWLLVTFYSFDYMAHEGGENRFYTFFTITLGVMTGIACAANLFTLYLFYESMTLATFPLVIHAMNRESITAGIKYLVYSFVGASMALIGIFFFYYYGAGANFIPGGSLNSLRIAGQEGKLLIVLFVAILGFGCKAGLFPLHAWLPTAHPIAPSPASGILSGIITKAGVIAIARLIYYVVGPQFLYGSWAQLALLIIILLTIFMGSMMAYREPLLKKRLAYSSISQVSYALFGLLLLNSTAFIGALLQIVFHAIIKNTLFLCAGSFIFAAGKVTVNDLRGIGKSMPFVTACFTVASLALIGIPPACGFISKWNLCLGSLDSNFPSVRYIGLSVLIISALLTAGYLLSIVGNAFFPGKDSQNIPPVKNPIGQMAPPVAILAALCFLLGLFPGEILSLINSIAAPLF